MYYYGAKLKYARKYLGRGRLILDMIQFDNISPSGVNFHVLFTVLSEYMWLAKKAKKRKSQYASQDASPTVSDDLLNGQMLVSRRNCGF